MHLVLDWEQSGDMRCRLHILQFGHLHLMELMKHGVFKLAKALIKLIVYMVVLSALCNPLMNRR